MAERTPATLNPTDDYGMSYEWAVDIDTSTTEEAAWQHIRFISAVAPSVEPVTTEAWTYEDQGSPNNVKTSESWSLAFYVQDVISADGSPLPEVVALEKLEAPDATGNKAFGHFRWYDAPFGDSRTPVATRAWEGYGTVKLTRAETGNSGIGGWNVEIQGRGRRKAIANPLTAPGE